MTPACQELTLQGALSDPLIRAVMDADGVDPVQLRSMLLKVAGEVAARRPAAARFAERASPACCASKETACVCA